jgi:hypothetical protein
VTNEAIVNPVRTAAAELLDDVAAAGADLLAVGDNITGVNVTVLPVFCAEEAGDISGLLAADEAEGIFRLIAAAVLVTVILLGTTTAFTYYFCSAGEFAQKKCHISKCTNRPYSTCFQY